MTLAPYVSPDLALYVERCRLEIECWYGTSEYDTTHDQYWIWYYDPNHGGGTVRCGCNAGDARDVYTEIHSKLLAAYLPTAPERGQLTDEVV